MLVYQRVNDLGLMRLMVVRVINGIRILRIVSKSKGLEPATPVIRVMIIVNHHDYNENSGRYQWIIMLRPHFLRRLWNNG